MMRRLLLFRWASFIVGFIEPVVVMWLSMMQNLLCIKPERSAVTKE